LEEVFSTNFIIGNFKLMLKLKKSFGWGSDSALISELQQIWISPAAAAESSIMANDFSVG
jgi:hypothetical protein